MPETPPRNDDFASQWVGAQPMIAAYIASVVGSFHETEDVLQKVATVAFEKRDQFDQTRSFSAWVNGIARYELMRWRRDKARDRHVFSDQTIGLMGTVHASMSDEFDDRRVALKRCFKKLEPQAKEIVELRYLHEMPPAGIAEKLRIEPTAARVRLHRIRRALEKCIQRQVRQGGRQHA